MRARPGSRLSLFDRLSIAAGSALILAALWINYRVGWAKGNARAHRG